MLPIQPAALHWARAPRQPGPLARRRVGAACGVYGPRSAWRGSARALCARRLLLERHGVTRYRFFCAHGGSGEAGPVSAGRAQCNAAGSIGSIGRVVARRTLGRLGAVTANAQRGGATPLSATPPWLMYTPSFTERARGRLGSLHRIARPDRPQSGELGPCLLYTSPSPR